MDSLPLSLEELERLIALFEEHRLTEVELREGQARIRLRSNPPRPTARETTETGVEDGGSTLEIDSETGPAVWIEEEPAPVSAASDTTGATPESRGWTAIAAPMTGTFYRAPSREDPPFVELGDPVEIDQTVGLIEAMKMYSEIKAEAAGMVAAIPVANGQMVPAGTVLVWLEPRSVG